MPREVIDVPVISEAIRRLGAPTSAAVRFGDLVMTCGMPPIDPATGEIVEGDIRAQTRAVLEALRVTLEHAGSSLDKVIKATVYVTDPDLMADVNEIYRVYFHDGFPARTSAAIKPWPLPFDIEIECVAAT
ncbi:MULTISPECIES: Rid family hydrolase [unclassified Ensifer]|uniref:RidA family protein n=1 Tax=unclassified Ensifer TaxID=2633371 RepID=UPI000813AAB0|nr:MULTISPECIES: Rid family hydrolase [unclassified Ensifer]OCP21363.1 enamine deaminase RidA [Ensifer sp. LC384]OCP22397.1 enamine deaminase RidA [Ensifer sp. LC54]